MLAAILVAASASPAACGGNDSGSSQRTDITVFAASSLTEAFNDAATAVEERDNSVDVSFNFAGSPALRAQLEQGARADVYASADAPNMQAAIDAGLMAGQTKTFARNQLTIIVPADNPGDIHGLPDLAKDSLRIVIAAEEVPAGRYTREMLDKVAADDAFVPGFREAVLANVVSEEPNVKSVVAKIQLGEADAGIVYTSDVTPEIQADVREVEIPLDYNVQAEYVIGITADAEHPVEAQRFIDFLLSGDGQKILEERGFIRAR